MLARSDHWAGTWMFRSRGVGHPKNVLGPPVATSIPPMLTEREFAALQTRLAETTSTWGGTHVADPYLLAGRIRSPHGTPMRGNWRKYRSTAYYMCGHTQKSSGWPRCECRTIQVDLLDELVWQTLAQQLIDTGSPHDDISRFGAATSAVSQDAATRALDLVRIATLLREAVVSSETSIRRRVIALLDVKVQVLGWRTCPTCNGKGWLPDPNRLPKLKTRRTGPRMWPQKCPECRGYRHVAEVEIAGVLPVLQQPTPTPDRGTPFNFDRRALGTESPKRSILASGQSGDAPPTTRPLGTERPER